MSFRGLGELDGELIFGDDWTDTAQLKLRSWKVEARQLFGLHLKAMKASKRIRDRLMLPIILSAAVTTVLLGLSEVYNEKIFVVIALLVSGFTAFLTGVQAHLNPGDKYSRHIEAANAYANLVRNLDYMMTLPPKKRPDVEVAYVMTTNAFDNIATTAPPLPFDALQKSVQHEPSADDPKTHFPDL